MHKTLLHLSLNSCSDNRKSKIENPKWVGIFTIVLVFAMGGAEAMAQQPGKIFRIGFLDPSTPSGSAVLVDAFRQELSKLGWIEGKNIIIEYRLASKKLSKKLSGCPSSRRTWFV